MAAAPDLVHPNSNGAGMITHADPQLLRRLFEFLGQPAPSAPIRGVDVYLPLLERARQDGAVVLLKWDGERSSNHYTALVSKPGDETACRLDGPSIEAVLSGVLIDYAHRHWQFPKE